jgi:hypothetical protein
MENKTIFLGLGVLAVGGFLAWKYLKQPTINAEEPTNEPTTENPTNPTNTTGAQTTAQGLKLGNEKPKVEDKADVKPATNVNTKAGGSTPVKGFAVDPNKMASAKSPFVNAKIMKDMSKKLPNGQIVPLFKKGDNVSVANTYGDSTMTYLEGNSSFKLKWDVDVYFPRYGSTSNTASGVGGAPQFDGGKSKGHNFPYFY